MNPIFETIVAHGEQTGEFMTFRSGSQIRYPHLELDVCYDNKNDCFLSNDPAHNARAFLSGDVMIRELLVPSARRLFLKDLLQIPYSEAEKLVALYDVSQFTPPPFELETIYPEGFGWESSLPLHLVKVESKCIFPFGAVAKGTDLAIIDQFPATRGQEIAHAIYHYREGIRRGAKNIIEIHASPFFIYALQCARGRLARRERTAASPHRIKFHDYIALRALAGTQICPGTYHGAIGILSAPMNLVGRLVDEQTLLDGLFDGSSQAIEDAVDDYLGAGAYEEIFGSFDLFGRLAKIAARKPEAVELMFEKPLFPSELSMQEIREVWENSEARNDDLIERLEGN